MIPLLEKHCVVVLVCASLYSQGAVFSADPTGKETDTVTLRKAFNEAVGEEFKLVTDRKVVQEPARGGRIYWLAHVKPRRTGRYILTYSYRYTHDRSHPQEGENQLFLRVAEPLSSRFNASTGLGSVCLGDTIIVPIRLDGVADHQFHLEVQPVAALTSSAVPEKQQPIPEITEAANASNPLKDHLTFLGSERHVMPHRGLGEVTVTYSARFKATQAGRFNLGLSAGESDGNPDQKNSEKSGVSIPVLIVNPGTPITSVAYHQKTINYSDNKRFSAHAGENFITTLMLLQPGDVFTIEYARRVEAEQNKGEAKTTQANESGRDHQPDIEKLPFMIDKTEAFNEWLIDYLPPEG